MKNTSLLFALLLYTSLASAQNSWSIGIDYYPNFSEDKSERSMLISEKKSPKFSNSIGFSLSRQLGPRWLLASGLGYANMGHCYTNNELRWGAQHNGNGGFDPTLPPGEDIEGIVIEYNYDYLELPVKLQYSPLTGPWRLYLSGGILLRAFLKEQNIIVKDLGGLGEAVAQENNVSDINPLALGLQSGLGLEHTMAGRYHLFMEPRVQLNFFGGQSLGHDFQGKYLSYGGALGVRLRLGE